MFSLGPLPEEAHNCRLSRVRDACEAWQSSYSAALSDGTETASHAQIAGGDLILECLLDCARAKKSLDKFHLIKTPLRGMTGITFVSFAVLIFERSVNKAVINDHVQVCWRRTVGGGSCPCKIPTKGDLHFIEGIRSVRKRGRSCICYGAFPEVWDA